MNQSDDVEKLFSWLQTPDIRYREFAGAREVTDAVSIVQVRTNTPQIDPPAPHNVQLDEEYPADQFPDQSQTEVEVEPASGGSAPAVHHEPPVVPQTLPPHPEPTTSTEPSTSTDTNDQTPRSLDSVFDRLAGGRASVRDPRSRASRIPGLGSSDGRPR